MAKAAQQITCPSCGFSNTLPLANRRCVSCGAKFERSRRSRARGGERRSQRRGFSFAWFGISLVIVSVMTGALVMGLPLVVPLLDFEGSAGMLVAIPAWFLSGLLIGLISPGKTFVEAASAALLIAIPTAAILHSNQTVKTMPAFLYALMSALGVLFALIGTHVGERIQVGPPPKTTD